MRNLLRHLAVRSGVFLAVAAAVLGGFEFIICAVVSTINIPALFNEIMKSVPPLMKDLITQYIGGFGPADLLAFGWYHPIALAIGGAVAVVLAARASAGEIEAGTLELVLSQPVSRPRYLAGQAVFAGLSLAGLSIAGAAGSYLGQRVYGLHALSLETLALLALNYFLLQAAWFGITLLLSVFGREAGRVAFAGFVIALLSYLTQVVAQIWPKAAFLLPYSVNAYYDPRVIVKSIVLPLRSVVVLAGLAVVCGGLSLWRFLRRDIP